jgi:hypothetical protein
MARKERRTNDSNAPENWKAKSENDWEVSVMKSDNGNLVPDNTAEILADLCEFC